MKKNRTDIDTADLEILATPKANPADVSQVERLAVLRRDEDPDSSSTPRPSKPTFRSAQE